MAKFFGVNLFKKSSSSHSADSPQMKKDFGSLSVRESSKNISNAPTVMWDAICDLNGSSDLDDSADFFYSRAGIFSTQFDKSSSPVQSASEKPHRSVNTSGSNKWKTNFLVPESSPRYSRVSEPTPISPSISRFQSKSQASPSIGFRNSSKLGKSPALKSNSNTLELEIAERDLPPNVETMNSPKAAHVNTDIDKRGPTFAEPGTSLELSTIDLDQSSEEEQQGANYHCHSEEEKNHIQGPPAYEGEQYKEVEACNSDGCDKLAILHMRLKNEAMKLENWKNDMISKLNKNEEKLAEANTLVASLRKSNLELQMDRENASLKVKDEVEKREAIEKKIIGTRDLCEAIKTQIEFVQSVCSSTMQTCFKTTTTQKALEALLENTFKDFQNLSIQLDESQDRNRSLAETQEQLNEKHKQDMNALSTRNDELTAELEKLASEKEDFASVFKKCDETLRNHVLKVRTIDESLELLLEAGSQMNFGLEEEIKRVNIELLEVKALNKEKETQISETLNKCSQLSDDLSRVYTLLQNSKNSCLERGQKITSLEEEIKKLTEEKGSIQDDLHKKSMINEAEVRSRQKELLLLTEKLNLTMATFNALVNEKDEQLKLLEQEKMNLLSNLSKTEEVLKCARARGNELRLLIEEKERITAEKDQLITTLKNTSDGCLEEVETLKNELTKSKEMYKDLEESHRTIASSLADKKRCLAETEEKLVYLQKNEDIRSREILDLKKRTSTQQDEIEDLTTKVRNLELDQNRLNSRNQDMNRCIELKNDQIVRLEERLHEAEQQVRVLENAAARAGQEVRTSSSSLAQRDAEVSQLREALHTAQADHATALRHCEEVRAELLGAVEQQQQESDRVLRQKENEIGSLKESLAALQKEADKSSKKIVSLRGNIECSFLRNRPILGGTAPFVLRKFHAF
ncbi:Laminin subunit alpha-2 [Taenia solium]|eukprot:TsM_000297200 transcript=TsM_000297200 gene=TsM_000297200